ncbi:MAG: hypothetical protein MZV70_67805 [Desulfobacterales bacterium]|nr:hypothetical protein [Desulfobacterales bacterium]
MVARSHRSGYLPLAQLEKGDFFGHIPFLTIGHEPYAAAVFSSADLKLAVGGLQEDREPNTSGCRPPCATSSSTWPLASRRQPW